MEIEPQEELGGDISKNKYLGKKVIDLGATANAETFQLEISQS